MNPMTAWIVPVAAMAMPVILVPTLVYLKSLAKRREWAHLERMEAIRNGLPTPSESTLPGSASMIFIGAGVPAVAIIAAVSSVPSQYSYGHNPDQLAQSAVVWGFASAISLGAMSLALILGVLRYRAHLKSIEAAARHSSGKPVYDPDAFDLAGRRGF